MRRHVSIGAVVVALLLGGRGPAGEPCEPSRDCFLKQIGPVGGWNPYGGGLLHWWDPCCFPRCGAPDDYCRKPLPRVCWPPYPSCFTSVSPEICHPQSKGPPQCNKLP
ncbi:MAG TPA: hypothetical protein VKI17_13770 [Gemmataceae bacterium]|nr:hypothetical protein [Gemmataceae bacterium]